MYSKGCGLFGTLGLNNRFADSEKFKLIPNHLQLSNIESVSTSWGHSAFYTTKGDFCVFGRPYEFSTLLFQHRIMLFSSAIARSIALSSYYLDQGSSIFPIPTLFDSFDGAKVVSIKCSAALTLVLTDTGKVYAFGSTKWGQCGLDTDVHGINDYMKDKKASVIYEPILIKLVDNIIAIETGLQHCLALTANGHMYAWGKCDRGQLGIGTVTNDKIIAHMQVKLLTNVIKISAGFNHSVALDSQGRVFVWGKGMSDVEKANQGEICIQLIMMLSYAVYCH